MLQQLLDTHKQSLEEKKKVKKNNLNETKKNTR